MRRREFVFILGGALASSPFAVRAQQTSRPRVGVLSPGHPPPQDAFHQRERFETGLRELGWEPNSSILIEYRYAEGKLERLPAMAAELVGLRVDVIVARGLTTSPARQATASIPIVMAAEPDPVRSGFVASLARPGGNITGLTTQALDSEAKQLELLRSALPALDRVALLTNPNSPLDDEQSKQTDAAARMLGIRLSEYAISGPDQLPGVFERMREAGEGAALFRGTLWFIDATQIATLVRRHHLPTVHNLPEFPRARALMSYGVNFAELHRRSATFVDKILKGIRPADLPVEQPTKFGLVINLQTARELGIELPPTLLARADEVIE
jgi:putative tryptophan/tyrosine transport system substrate-binding protein